MGRVGGEWDDKSHLVAEICSFLSPSVHHCRLHRWSPPSSFLVDWYLLLRVDEDAHVDVIRRQYRKLALQLHPDKNKHPKAEIAFKLVSEAYACLSNEAKRKAFDYTRCNNFCQECNNQRQYKTSSAPTKRASTNTALQELKERFREEVRIIEKCLKANNAPSKEFPVFNTTQVYRKSDVSRGRSVRNLDGRRGKCETPVFEIGSDKILGQRRSVYLRS